MLIEVIAAWGRGWAVSRGVPAPAAVPGGWRFDVGRPGNRVRYVLHTYDPATLTWDPGTWVKLCGPDDDLRAVLPGAWTMFNTGYLMTAPLSSNSLTVPDPYRLDVSVADRVADATVVSHSGEVAASGRLVAFGSYGMIDEVETAAEHRRRGLGTVIMRALTNHAVGLGLRTGILIATAEGRRLYESVGWTLLSPVAAAFVPE